MRIKQFCVSGTKESETIVAHNTWGGQRGLLDEKNQDGNFLKNEYFWRRENILPDSLMTDSALIKAGR